MLTPAEIDAEPAGRRMDVEIVRRIFGWTKLRDDYPFPQGNQNTREEWHGEPPDRPHIIVCVPRFSTDIAAAWSVIGRALREGLRIRAGELARTVDRGNHDTGRTSRMRLRWHRSPSPEPHSRPRCRGEQTEHADGDAPRRVSGVLAFWAWRARQFYGTLRIRASASMDAWA